MLSIYRTALGDRLCLEGEVDINSAPGLASALLALPEGGDVVIDLTDLRFMDASGVRALVEGSHRLRMTLESPAPAVRRMLELSRVTELGPVRIAAAQPVLA